MHHCLLQEMREGLSVPGSVLSVNGCLTAGTQGESCEYTLHHAACDSCGIHVIHTSWYMWEVPMHMCLLQVMAEGLKCKRDIGQCHWVLNHRHSG